MVDFNPVQNFRDCRADKSQISRSREIGPLQNVNYFLFRIFEGFVLINKSFDWLITEYKYRTIKNRSI